MTLAALLAAALVAGCGSDAATGSTQSAAEEGSQAASETAQAAGESQTEEAQAADTQAAGEQAEVESKGTITVAATSVPHAEILEAAKPLLAAQGWELEVTEFTDYVQPNEVVESGDIDANYFQHITYMESQNEEKGMHLVDA